MSSRCYRSTDAALAAICTSDDVATAAYLFNGDRPTVIRVLHEEEQYGGGYLLVIEDDGLGVNRKHFRTINEFILLLAPEPDDHPTYNEAAFKVIEDFKAYATSSGGTR